MADEAQAQETPIKDIPAEETSAELPSVEEVARELGWKPEAEYKGAPENYRGPVDFIKHGQAGNLVQEIKALKTTQERLVRTTAATTARLLDEQAAEINTRWQQAVDDGDHAATRKAENELRQLEASRNDASPEAEFASANPWYGKDEDATAYAVSISQREAQKGRSIPDQLEAAQSAVRKRFPELFDDAEPRATPKAPRVGEPSTRTAAAPKREKGWNDLSAAEKQAGDSFVEMATAKGWKYTRDDYARTAWAEKGEAA